jgi:hypothetical protein
MDTQWDYPDRAKSSVFSLDLKTASDSDGFVWSHNAFHTLGAEKQKAALAALIEHSGD